MDAFTSLASKLSEEIYGEIKTALELGKWESGEVLNESQKEICIQLIIAYETVHLEESERTAFINRPEHEACDNLSSSGDQEERAVKFKP